MSIPEKLDHIVIAGPDPARAEAELPTTFGIDELDGPAVQTYSVHPDDIEATVASAREHGYDPGDIWDLSRRTPSGELLEWRLAGGADRRLDVPFLIDWGSTPQPGLGDIPAIDLVSFVRVESDPAPLRTALDALGLGAGVAEIEAGDEPGFRLVLRRADGSTVSL